MGMIRNAGKVIRLNMPNAIVKPRIPDEIQAVVWATQTHNQRIHTGLHIEKHKHTLHRAIRSIRTNDQRTAMVSMEFEKV